MSMSRSTYYFELKKSDVVAERNAELTAKVEEIFADNKQRYGVRRVCQELHNQGQTVNHKRVQRIMHNENMFGIRPKEKYHSY